MRTIHFKNPLQLPLREMRFLCLLAGIGIYALFGTPTPDAPGLAECAVGALLIAAAGAGGLRRALSPAPDKARWEKAGGRLLFYGASVPILAALAAGNDPYALARDLVFFLFFLLPLFLHPLFFAPGAPPGVYTAEKKRVFTGAVILLGLIFSLRVLLPFLMHFEILADPAYLANAPTVLFSALFLAGLCGLRLYRGDYTGSILILLLAAIPLSTMALIVQRASVGAAILAAAILLGTGLIRKPLRTLIPLCLLGLTGLVYAPFLGEVFQNIIHKTERVGLNMRWQEALAVFGAIDDSLLTVLFGKGWGAMVFSPAAGGVTVNFTHSLITTFWLKTGLTGVFLALAYLFRIAQPLFPLLFTNPVLALALAAPFMIDVLFYASFKSLDFGLLLLLIVLSGASCERLQKSRPCSMQEQSPDKRTRL